jgi:hypothetical protein
MRGTTRTEAFLLPYRRLRDGIRNRLRRGCGPPAPLSALGVSPFDPVAYLDVPVLMIGVATLATWLPIRQALRSDPVTDHKQVGGRRSWRSSTTSRWASPAASDETLQRANSGLACR